MKRKYNDNLILSDLKNGVKIKEIMIKYGIRGSKTIYDIKNRINNEPCGRKPIK